MVMNGIPVHGPTTLPLTGSHEGVGVIAKLGPEVDTTKFKVGDRVGTLNYYYPCGIKKYSLLS
jgi:D-arabinose 1-dehydrogenase-like Zn-dependent alcohol dehydrogenase